MEDRPWRTDREGSTVRGRRQGQRAHPSTPSNACIRPVPPGALLNRALAPGGSGPKSGASAGRRRRPSSGRRNLVGTERSVASICVVQKLGKALREPPPVPERFRHPSSEELVPTPASTVGQSCVRSERILRPIPHGQRTNSPPRDRRPTQSARSERRRSGRGVRWSEDGRLVPERRPCAADAYSGT